MKISQFLCGNDWGGENHGEGMIKATDKRGIQGEKGDRYGKSGFEKIL
jgi:hypothetical protein